MKYFIDTEFIEGFSKPMFGKRSHFIDLISIGIAGEDGREYYAISNEWNYKDADEWVKKNVIIPMYADAVHGDNRNRYDANNFHFAYGKSNKKIAEEIKHFCNPELFLHNTSEPNVEFYGYYADYDWVVFCSLFGRMIDLPKGFPMYCRDLKQMIDEKASNLLTEAPSSTDNMEGALAAIKRKSDYPKQEKEHNALDDARWNFELYKWLEYVGQ